MLLLLKITVFIKQWSNNANHYWSDINHLIYHTSITLPVFVAYKKVMRMLSSKKKFIIKNFYSCHPIWVIITGNLEK